MYNKSINKIFQFIWYSIKWLWPKKKTDFSINYREKRIVNQIKLALFFSKIFRVKLLYIFLGDSNGEVFRSFNDMKKFPGLAVNISIGGTRADHWYEWLTEDPEGKWVLSIIQMVDESKEGDVIWDIGGNHVLQDKMDNLEKFCRALKRLVPNSWNITIPPVHIPSKMKEVMEANIILKDIWQENLFDTFSKFYNPDTNSPVIGTHMDWVHYAQKTQNYILEQLIPTIDAEEK